MTLNTHCPHTHAPGIIHSTATVISLKDVFIVVCHCQLSHPKRTHTHEQNQIRKCFSIESNLFLYIREHERESVCRWKRLDLQHTSHTVWGQRQQWQWHRGTNRMAQRQKRFWSSFIPRWPDWKKLKSCRCVLFHHSFKRICPCILSKIWGEWCERYKTARATKKKQE